ncbi:MAG: hypothetical protein AAFQ04_12850 [Pseudomonadota bacterium]
MGDHRLSVEDIEYVADMLRAIAWVKDELGPVSNEAISDLEASLGSAEAALRRIAAEMELTVTAGVNSN